MDLNLTQLVENLRSLGQRRLLLLASVGLGIVVALLVLVSTVLQPTYRPVFTDLTPSDASKIVAALEQSGFRPEVSADGSVISVPEEGVARARMVVAEAGLSQQGAPGWELFDSATGIGMNSFMQRVNRMRALEGELARSIQTLNGVEAARVHLVLPEREAFSRSAPEPSASVVVRAAAGAEMSRRQAVAVRNLVASAVPDLAADRVTVLSATGQVILAEGGPGGLEADLQSTRAGIEDRLARNIEAILNARVGPGNARVQVSADLSTERRVIVQESYDPDQQIARRIDTREEQSEGQEAGDAPVGVENNIPAALIDNEQGAGGSRESSTLARETVDFAIGNTRSETIIEPGEIERLSVAVLVNGIQDVQPGGGAPVYRERTAEELARLEQLVRSAVGFDAARGDTVSVESMRFMDYTMSFGETPAPTLSQTLQESLPQMLRLVFALALVAMVLLFAVRPAMARLGAATALDGSGAGGGELALAQPAPDSETPLLAGSGQAGESDPEATAAAALPGPDPEQAPVADFNKAPEGPPEYVSISSVKGAVLKQHLEAVANLVDQEPDAALSVIRGWLKQAE